MRQPTIWESASRPLFVRSVWLATANAARSHRRHFILDYEPHERRRWHHKLHQHRGVAKQSRSCELYEDYDQYLLLDATKLTLQQQQQQQQQQASTVSKATSSSSSSQRSGTRHARRRAWLVSSGKTAHGLLEPYSRRSSLQDIQSTLSSNLMSSTTTNPEERLAERVLNWLDLAGRTDMVKQESLPSASSTHQPRSSNSQKRLLRGKMENAEALRRANLLSKRSFNASARNQLRSRSGKPLGNTSTSANGASNAGNAKPITIIFNKEGVPVRFNRAARNIDLCALSHSASATRRMAGQLASARLYSGAATPSPRAQGQPTPAQPTENARSPPLSSRGTNAAAIDCKKQLHIFMPSLPKKGLGGISALGSEDGQQSALSVAFSELCQI